MAMLERGRVALLPLGDLWQTLDADGYDGVRTAIESYTLPVLWQPVATTVLAVPGLLLFGLTGLALLLLFRRRDPAAKRLF